MHKFKVILLLVVLPFFLFSQTIIDVAENTMKVPPSGEEIFYYGFAEGDQILLNFQEVNGKELKEFEISLLNGNPIFMDFKVSKISNKTLTIQQTGIYKFRLTNSNILAGRVCKIDIKRIPESEATKKFNTTVFSRTIYDTAHYVQAEKFLVKSDTVINEIENKTIKINSFFNGSGNRQTVNFTIPDNAISWSYYVGVDQAGQKAYDDASKQLINSSTPMLTKIVGANPLAALALGLPSFLTQIQGDEDVLYYLSPLSELSAFRSQQQIKYYKSGKVINAFSSMEAKQYPQSLVFCFENDNKITPINVMLKVTVVLVNAEWETRQVKKFTVSTRSEMYLKN